MHFHRLLVLSNPYHVRAPPTRIRPGGQFFRWDLVAHVSKDADKSDAGVSPISLFLWLFHRGELGPYTG